MSRMRSTDDVSVWSRRLCPCASWSEHTSTTSAFQVIIISRGGFWSTSGVSWRLQKIRIGRLLLRRSSTAQLWIVVSAQFDVGGHCSERTRLHLYTSAPCWYQTAITRASSFCIAYYDGTCETWGSFTIMRRPCHSVRRRVENHTETGATGCMPHRTLQLIQGGP
jgi:hypothetical protein